MKIGTFSPEIPAGGAAELFRKAKGYGFSEMQFDYLSVDKEEMPESISEELNKEIAAEAAKNGIKIVAVNGTFNMSHPDAAVRQDGVKRFEKIAASCAVLSCNLITLCTGTRTRESMWVPHPDNETTEAWKDMASIMKQVITIADKYNVNLGIETEASNVVNTPQKAKKLFEEFGSPRLKIILDAANLFREGMAKREKVKSVIGEAFDLLGQYIVLAHGKDIKEGDGIDFTGAGQGIIDFEYFFTELEKIRYKGGIVIHGIKDEKDIPYCVDFVQKKAEPFKSFG
jgi:sugar phosphate isomerase/epimerase